MTKSVKDLTDQELESCINGTTNLTMIREILAKPEVVDELGWLDPEIFADWFASGIQGYISAEPDTDEWTEAYDNNWNWGYDIADSINDLISDDQTDSESV